MKKRKLKKSIIAKFIIFVSLIGIIYSSYDIIKWKRNVKENTEIKEQINKSIEIIPNEETQETEYVVDFVSIKERNSDAVAYLKVNNTNIDYIVVKGQDNTYYLNHNFDKKYNPAGWVFADYHNRFDGTDKNIVVYGHNMKDGSMFNTLKATLKSDWYKNSNNHKITFITEDKKYFYEVFSTYTILAEDYYINTIFTSDEEYEAFLKKIKSRSVYNYKVDLTTEDRILTLSSCIGNGEKRVVLHAKLINIDEQE